MTRQLTFLLVFASMLIAHDSPADVSAKDNNAPETALSVGKWNVEFTNGVNEVCSIGNNGEVTVEEPRRRSNGMSVARGGSFVLIYYDDRAERWTPVGRRFVVEHWFPASRLSTSAPVLGIAERAQ